MSDRTVREMIEEIRVRVRDEELTPSEAAEALARLSSLYGNVLRELSAAEIAYNHVLMECLNRHEKANRATIEAKTTPEYTRLHQAKSEEKVVVELIRSLRHLVRVKTEEMRLT